MIKRIREPVNGLTHFGGAVAAAAGLVFLLIFGGDGFFRTASLLVYGLSVIALFSASAAYHLVKGKPAVLAVLRKLDHAAIYLLIAGTYTPFCVIGFSGFWQWGMLALIWSLAAVGIAVKIFIIKVPRWVNAGVYLLMGWLSLIAIREMLALPPPAVGWLAAGGLLYTVGAVVYILKKPDFYPGIFGFHEVWHIFVLLAAAAHFTGVFSLVLAIPPA
jgi:hemolysin III